MRRVAVVTAILAFLAAVAPAPAFADHDCAALDPFAPALADELAADYPGKRFSAEVTDSRTGCTFVLNPELRITTASVIKIEVMAGILLRAQREGRSLTTWEADRIGPMIRESSDPETSELWLSLGGAPGMEALDAEFGMIHTIHASPGWGATSTSAHDQVTLVRQVVGDWAGPLDSASKALARSYMTTVIESQQWGITAGVPDDWTVALKNGFYPLTGIGWRINSVGVAEDPTGGGYAVAILTDGWGTEAEGIEANEGVARAVAANLAIEGLRLEYDGTFWDDDHSIFEADIEVIAAAGITRGCNPPDNDRFCPDAEVTRGEMAAFLQRLLQLPATSADAFVDDDGGIFEADIDAIAGAGITKGCNPPDNDRFCPGDPVTRGEMAAFLARALELDPTTGDRFTDDDLSRFEADIEAIAAASVTLGCNPPTNDRFCPNADVTRGQMAAFLARALALD